MARNTARRLPGLSSMAYRYFWRRIGRSQNGVAGGDPVSLSRPPAGVRPAPVAGPAGPRAGPDGARLGADADPRPPLAAGSGPGVARDGDGRGAGDGRRAGDTGGAADGGAGRGDAGAEP